MNPFPEKQTNANVIYNNIHYNNKRANTGIVFHRVSKKVPKYAPIILLCQQTNDTQVRGKLTLNAY